MQQTQKYDLNLIELDDPFSPEPINQNTQKLVAKLSALDGADAALGERVTVLEGHKLAVGTYTGNGATAARTIHLGFKPSALLLQSRNSTVCMVTPSLSYGSNDLVITEDGFSVKNDNFRANSANLVYIYLAVK